MKAEGAILLFSVLALAFGFWGGRKSRQGEVDRHRTATDHQKYLLMDMRSKADSTIQEYKADQVRYQDLLQKRDTTLDKLNANIKSQNVEIAELKDVLAKLLHFQKAVLEKIKVEAVTLPSVVRWMNQLNEAVDQQIINRMVAPPHPSPKSAEQVKEARALARQWQQEAELLRNKLDLYEAQAPWLVEYAEYSVEEIVAGINEELEIQRAYQTGDDPVRLFMSPDEYVKLSESQRNQLALDRYWQPSRSRSAWVAGIQYERYVGYLYEQDGYAVEYHGALQGKSDLGIDLICKKGKRVDVIQCKRLSPAKGLPVRENIVAQIFGAAMFYAMRHGIETSNVKPVIVTTYELSKEAREFADLLGVVTREYEEFAPYPCVKCNISERTGERIYHLPFDQQYDSAIIGNVDGEFYAMTVAEAERAKFRRAYRWKGQA